MENKISQSKVKKISKILVVELVLLGIIFGLLFLFYPNENRGNVEGYSFLKFSNIDTLLIDESPNFSSPKKVSEEEIKLAPGTYYWKAFGLLGESQEGNFSVNSSVIINMKIIDSDAILENKGDIPIEVNENRQGVIIGKMIIEVNESKVVKEVNEKSVFEAKGK